MTDLLELYDGDGTAPASAHQSGQALLNFDQTRQAWSRHGPWLTPAQILAATAAERKTAIGWHQIVEANGAAAPGAGFEQGQMMNFANAIEGQAPRSAKIRNGFCETRRTERQRRSVPVLIKEFREFATYSQSQGS